jgi:hypothetical protein
MIIDAFSLARQNCSTHLRFMWQSNCPPIDQTPVLPFHEQHVFFHLDLVMKTAKILTTSH